MSKTITILIGNSDDKLTQKEWHDYVERVATVLDYSLLSARHFSGASPNYAPWQNFAWVVEIDEEHLPGLKKALQNIRQDYRQDSVAIVEGTTEFI